MLFALLYLTACGPSGEVAVAEERTSASGGPSGSEVPINAVPWVLLRHERIVDPKAGTRTREALTDRDLRDIRLVDRTGRDVPVQRVVATQVAGDLVHIVPNRPLDKDSDYRVMVPGALMQSFRTGRSADKAAPKGGQLRDWTWESSGCPTLTLRHGPVKDSSTVAWEVESQRADRRDVFFYATGWLLPGNAADPPPIVLRGCDGGNFELPVAELLVRVRWVDVAGNATDWSPTVTVPGTLAYGAGTVEGAVSAAR